MNATEYAERTEQQFNEMAALAKEFQGMANQAIDERNALRAENARLRMDLESLFDELHMMERNESKIPAPIDRWWRRVTERQFSSLAQTKEST